MQESPMFSVDDLLEEVTEVDITKNSSADDLFDALYVLNVNILYNDLHKVIEMVVKLGLQVEFYESIRKAANLYGALDIYPDYPSMIVEDQANSLNFMFTAYNSGGNGKPYQELHGDFYFHGKGWTIRT